MGSNTKIRYKECQKNVQGVRKNVKHESRSSSRDGNEKFLQNDFIFVVR